MYGYGILGGFSKTIGRKPRSIYSPWEQLILPADFKVTHIHPGFISRLLLEVGAKDFFVLQKAGLAHLGTIPVPLVGSKFTLYAYKF